MTKESGSQSPIPESPGTDDQYKSKRGRKPSQAKLAMLESKKLFADSKKRLIESDPITENGSGKKLLKKKKFDDSKNKKNFDLHSTKLKRKKSTKNKADLLSPKAKASKRGFNRDEDPEEEPKKRQRKHPLRYRDGDPSEDNSSEGELWEEHDDDRGDDLFFDSDNDDLDNEFLQNTDEDTEDASETDMATLEEEISVMKEKMCQEKIKEVKLKIEELHAKTLPEYVKSLEELKKQRDDWIRMAYAFKAYEEREIDKEFEREKKMARHELELKRSELKEVLVSELSEKKRLIESERSALDLTGSVSSLLPMEVKPIVTRKLRRRPNDPPQITEKKKKTPSAQLSFLLNEEQILSDLKKLNKHCKSPQDDKAAIIKAAIKPEKCDPADFPDGSDAKTKDDKLYFNKEWYQAGDTIYLNSRDGERFNAQIHSITNTKEIWIKKLNEGTRLKIYVGHLQRGKYAIERRDPKKQKND